MTVSRLFNTQEDAEAAVAELREARFSQWAVHLITAQTVSAAALKEAGVVKANAEAYAPKISAGAALVVVDTVLGQAAKATSILAKHGPAGDAVTYEVAEDTSGATPLSSLMMLPVLSDNPAPLSTWLGWSILSKRQQGPDKSFGRSTLTKRGAAFSFGLPLLSHVAAPLSRLFRWNTLLDDAAPLSGKAKMPVLSADATPLSNRARIKVLSDEPAPFSNALGLPVLLKR